MEPFWIAIITPVATVTFNAIYLVFVRKQFDKRIEEYKIAYSGIFKEKLEMYKQVLNTMDDLKDKVVRFGHGAETSGVTPLEIMEDVNRFIRFNQQGAIFYSREIEKILENIRRHFQEVFDASYRNYIYQRNLAKNEEFEDYLSKLKNLTEGDQYHKLKQELISNIRKDFCIK